MDAKIDGNIAYNDTKDTFGAKESRPRLDDAAAGNEKLLIVSPTAIDVAFEDLGTRTSGCLVTARFARFRVYFTG